MQLLSEWKYLVTLSFSFISYDDKVKELNKLKSKKASQKTDIPL